jgi:hypothetical protein
MVKPSESQTAEGAQVAPTIGVVAVVDAGDLL